MKLALVLLAALTSQLVLAQTDDSVTARIILVGDAGALVNGKHPVVSSIKKHMGLDKKTTVVFLGDNLYRHGLPDESHVNYTLTRAVLDSQMNVAENTPSQVYMVPGNHDWENGSPNGWDAILRQEIYVNTLKDRNVHFIPSEGCPGPVEVPLGPDAVMIAFDSQWWIHRYDKPGVEWDCPCKTETEFTLELSELLRKNYNKLVILACHHPFMSNGIHGGYFGLKQHVFPLTDWKKNLYIPLPIIGSIYPISRSVFGSHQDMNFPAYQNMINKIQVVARSHPNIVYATGHDHSLQLLKDSIHHYIVSGTGCQTSRVEDSRKSLFTRDSMGYAVVEVSKNRMVRVKFFTVDISTAVPKQVYSETIIDFSKLPPLSPDTARMEVPKYDNFYVAPASTYYKKASKLKLAIMGKNYRDIWATPVKLKVFRINEEHGGFKIEAMGGGKQTKNLSLVDKQGRKWSLRTIDKEPDLALPENFRGSMAADIVQDMVSAAQPYAPMMVAALEDAVKIPHATPQYYMVPNDPAFGYYRPLFANKVCMLERKDPSWDDSDTKSSITVFNNMVEDNDFRVNEQEVLKARLMDMWVADWDRHMDQWKFGVRKDGKLTNYYPIPRDRDQAFFYSDGMLIKWLSRRRMRFLKGFRDNIPDIKHLNTTAKDFDRLFMNELDRNDWDSVATQFTAALTDTVIAKAAKQMPPEIYALNGQQLVDKLIKRRSLLQKEALKYYHFMAQNVNVLGSNKPERFNVFNQGDSLRVQVHALTGKDTSRLIYDRIFDPKETEEIRLYGFRGNDQFYIDANAKSKTAIRIIGGKGEDSFMIKGNIKNYLYDLTTEKNHVEKGNRTHERFSANPMVNNYDFNEFNYNISHFPRLQVGYNADDGFMMGIGAWYRRHSFRKAPYSSEQRFGALVAFVQKAYQFKYSGIFTDVFPKTDLVVKAELVNPSLSNFFGFGNNTKVQPDSNISFYRVRYKNIAADVVLRKKIASAFSVFAGPSFYHYWAKPVNNEGYILDKPGAIGIDSQDVYTVKSYAGGRAGLLLYNLNNDLFPTRGISWLSTFTQLQPLNKQSSPLTKLESDLVVYASLNNPARWVTVVRLGAAKIYSKNLEYFQALNLGANNYLRGFRKNRFSGNSLAYGSLEFRYKLLESNSYVFPGQLGLVAFNDVGRVWYKGESSKQWHYAYGGGFYYVPYNMIMISTTVAFSKEETLVNFTLGTKLNLTF